MKRLLALAPALILSCYFVAGNIAGFSIPAMRIVSAAGLALLVVALYLRNKSGGVSAIDTGFLLYMAFNGLVFWGFPQLLAPLAAKFSPFILYLILFGVVALPALFRKSYFTEYFARKSTPAAVWETEIFKTINRHMTWAWAALLALCAATTLIPHLFHLPASPLTNITFQFVLPTVMLLGAGIPFNRKYPEYYQRKLGIDASLPPVSTQDDEPATKARNAGYRHKEDEMADQLKVVALNGSPHGAIGNTSQMIEMLASTLATEGIALEEIMVVDQRIEYCVGCAVCLEGARCWRTDDHAGIMDKLLAADGVILASPVYFGHVTAQLKTFIDRSLSYGHKPRTTWKPGLAVSVSAGKGETDTGLYLARSLRAYGAFPAGTLTAIATRPGEFLGKELVEARARDLAHDLARAIKEKRQYPATDDDLSFYLFMRNLVTREKEFMRDDFNHWQETGLLGGFEAYTQQQFSVSEYNPEARKEWVREMIKADRGQDSGAFSNGEEKVRDRNPSAQAGPASIKTCHELFRKMPLGFKAEAAKGLVAVYQFEISGAEEFAAHLKIADSRCTFHEGSHEKPDVIVKSPADVWLAISRGEMKGEAAFMTGKYKVEGNIGLLMKLKSMFG